LSVFVDLARFGGPEGGETRWEEGLGFPWEDLLGRGGENSSIFIRINVRVNVRDKCRIERNKVLRNLSFNGRFHSGSWGIWVQGVFTIVTKECLSFFDSREFADLISVIGLKEFDIIHSGNRRGMSRGVLIRVFGRGA
jgi:hypothetical protein